MRLSIFLFLAIALFSCSNQTDKNRLRVIGEGKVRVMPNQVILTIQVENTRPRMADAVAETQHTVDSVVSILKGFSMRRTDVKTSSVSADKDYTYTNNRQVFVGFNASQSIEFTLNDIAQFTNLTGKLLATRISSISSIQFAHSKTDSLLREADLLAYDDAFQSATKLAARAKVTVGKVVYLSNDASSAAGDVQLSIQGNQMNTFNKAYGGNGISISPQVLEFRRAVVAEYALVR